MKTRLMRWLGAVALSTAAAAAVAWPGGYGLSEGRDPGRMLAHMADQLELSQEQEDQIRELISELREQSAADRERLAELRALTHAAAEDFDAGQVQLYADEIGEITSRMVFRATSIQAAVYQMLTTEQREALTELEAQRDERREHWRRKHRSEQQPG